MNALWLEAQHAQLRQDLAEPEPQAGEALLALRCAGVCSTDLELIAGYMPHRGVLGHEFVAEVIAAPGASQWLGQRVVGEINMPCGCCAVCQRGEGNHCPQRSVLGIVGERGAFAERFCLPLANLQVVPEAVSDEAAVFCEPLAAALAIPERVEIRPSQRVLLVGAGRLGQLIARVIALTGAQLDVVCRHQRQRERLASTNCRCLDEGAVAPKAYDLVIDAGGTPQAFALACAAVRPRGKLVVKSTQHARVEIDLSALVVDEVTLVGSRCGPFAPALRLLQSELVDPRPLIEARYRLAEAERALEHARRPGALKVLLSAAAS